jgi:hypothetical protein
MAVNSDTYDLARAFARHLSTSVVQNACRRSRLMALFYAAECGLKFLYMDDGDVTTTKELKTKLAEEIGKKKNEIDLHDIEMLCQVTSVVPADTGTPPPFTVGASSHETFRIHEAARYGVKLPDVYLTEVEIWLSKVNAEVRLRMKDKGAYHGC